jgi:E3 ubiquitin-protein ligase synoviolin
MASTQRPSSAFLSAPPVVYRTLPPRHVPQPQARPLATLPPTLTDAQLAQLDMLTRDAIDERLRVLESVSSAMYRCAEELTRLRSVLPVATGPVSAPAPAPAPTQVRSEEPGQGPPTQAAANESGDVPGIPSLDSDSELDARSSNAKPGTDVSSPSDGPVAGSVEANGDIANTPGSAN